MKKRVKVLPCFVALGIAYMTCTSVFGASNVFVNIPADRVWTGVTAHSATRSGDSKLVAAKLISVVPLGEYEKDKYTTINCRCVDKDGNNITEDGIVDLVEGAESREMTLEDGNYGLEKVYFQFRGRKDKGARAVVSYSGR